MREFYSSYPRRDKLCFSMVSKVSGFASELRHELCARNAAFAEAQRFSHVKSYGAVPVIVYAPEADGRRHGNFFGASYRAILKHPEWMRRMTKIHAQARRSLPTGDFSLHHRWRELDSCMSSDALLMNIFCCPGACTSKTIAGMLGIEVTDMPEFGHRARVPLLNAKFDRTEVDMKLGKLLVESKLTENDFQSQESALVERYRDLETIFDVPSLPRSGDHYLSYQLIRNVLAAYASGTSFCVIADARRPDLIEAWHTVMRCVRDVELRTRCKVLTWQELSRALPRKLQKFLDVKYGIGAPANNRA